MDFLQKREKQEAIILTDINETLHAYCFLPMTTTQQSQRSQIHLYLNEQNSYIPLEKHTDHTLFAIAKHSIITIAFTNISIQLDLPHKKNKVNIILHNGSELSCELYIEGSPGQQRILDFLNHPNHFLEAWNNDKLSFINKHYIYKIQL